jgi:hypothetical protein
MPLRVRSGRGSGLGSGECLWSVSLGVDSSQGKGHGLEVQRIERFEIPPRQFPTLHGEYIMGRVLTFVRWV